MRSTTFKKHHPWLYTALSHSSGEIEIKSDHTNSTQMIDYSMSHGIDYCKWNVWAKQFYYSTAKMKKTWSNHHLYWLITNTMKWEILKYQETCNFAYNSTLAFEVKSNRAYYNNVFGRSLKDGNTVNSTQMIASSMEQVID